MISHYVYCCWALLLEISAIPNQVGAEVVETGVTDTSDAHLKISSSMAPGPASHIYHQCC